MSTEWIGKAIEAFQSPRPAAAILFACVVLLLLPASALDWLGAGVRETAVKFRFVLVLAALLCFGLLLFDAAKGSGVKRTRHALLEHLSGEERRLLKWLLEKNKGTLGTGVLNDACESLIVKGIMTRRDAIRGSGDMTYVLEAWAWQRITSKPDLVD